MASQSGFGEGEGVVLLHGGADTDGGVHLKGGKRSKHENRKSGGVDKQGNKNKMVGTMGRKVKNVTTNNVDEPGLSMDERRANKLAGRQAEARRRRKVVRNLAHQLRNLQADPNHDSVDASILHRRLTVVTRQLEILEEKLGPSITELVENHTPEPDDEQDPSGEDLDEPVVKLPSKSRKRRLSQVSQDNDSGEESGVGYTVKEFVIIHDSPSKEKKEKKRRNKEKFSQDSSVSLDSLPAFINENEHTTTEEPITKKNFVLARKDEKKTTQEGSASPPTSDKAKQDALLATIRKARSPAEKKISDALIAGMTVSNSPIESNHESLIAVGQAAMAAPPLGSQSPRVRMHKESPILPPQRNFSATRVVPKMKPVHTEKIKSKSTKNTGSKNSNSNSKVGPGKEGVEPDGESLDSAASFQTSTALKEAASATVINGIFSQADPFTTAAPNSAIKRPRALSFLNNIDSSSPASTPTKVRVSKDNEASSSLRKPTKSHHSKYDKFGKGIEAEEADWEAESGRVRARISREGSGDDEETEENIAFSSSYLASRPLGISISGTKFQVLQIISGIEQELPILTSQDNKAAGIRICSVAKSQVKVSLGGKKFVIGEGGMWRVRSGERCVVANQLGSQDVAVVHVSTVES